jgi:hypothetical protein
MAAGAAEVDTTSLCIPGEYRNDNLSYNEVLSVEKEGMKLVAKVRTTFLLLMAGLLSFSQSFAIFHVCEMACCKVSTVSRVEAPKKVPEQRTDSDACCHHSTPTTSITSLVKCCCDEAEVTGVPERDLATQLRILETQSVEYTEPAAFAFTPKLQFDPKPNLCFETPIQFNELLLESRRSRGPPVA